MCIGDARLWETPYKHVSAPCGDRIATHHSHLGEVRSVPDNEEVPSSKNLSEPRL